MDVGLINLIDTLGLPGIVAVLADAEPGGAGGAGGNSMMLALGLMVAGALVLRHALRPRKDDPVLRHPGRVLPLSEPQAARPPARELDEETGARKDGGADDARAVLVEVKQLRMVLADETDRHAERLEALIARAEATIRRLETLSASDAASRSAERGDGVAPVDPLNRRIYELADQGLPPVDIARTLQQQTGKVELVLALRPR